MTNNFMGRTQIKECPHKTVSRFYDSQTVSLWRCDWCGQEFRAVDGENKMVELKEVGTATTTSQPSAERSNDLKASDPYDSSMRATVSGTAHGPVIDTRPGDYSASQVEALPDRGAAPNKRMRRV